LVCGIFSRPWESRSKADGAARSAIGFLYRPLPHSCGHRHRPHCQHHESQQWLERQMRKQVPAEYFLLTFTLPAEFRALTWARQSVVYDMLMRCCWETVHTFSQNDKQLQGTPGAIAVLHANTRRPEYHPNVHLVMPAAASEAKPRSKPFVGRARPLSAGRASQKICIWEVLPV
jgi:hypothetical protein